MGVTPERIAEAKRRFPSCARDWDVEMVEKAWDRLSTILPKRLQHLDTAVLSAETRSIYGMNS